MNKLIWGIIILVINFVFIVSGITCFIVFFKGAPYLVENLYYFGWVAIGAATGTFLTIVGSLLLLWYACTK